MSLYSQSNLLILGKLIQIHENFIPKEQALLVKKIKLKQQQNPFKTLLQKWPVNSGNKYILSTLWCCPLLSGIVPLNAPFLSKVLDLRRCWNDLPKLKNLKILHDAWNTVAVFGWGPTGKSYYKFKESMT